MRTAAPPSRTTAPPRWAIEVLAVVVAAAGPFVRSRDSVPSSDLLVAGVAVGAGIVLAALPARLGPPRLVVVVLAAAALAPAEGVLLAGWAAGGLLAADWGVRGRSPLPSRLPPRPIPVVVSTLLLGAALVAGPETRPAAAVVGLVGVAVAVAALALLLGDRRPAPT